MKKVLLVLLFIIVAGAGVGGTVYFYKKYDDALSERNQMVQQNAELQVALEAIGPITKAWTVTNKGEQGVTVKEEDLTEQTVLASSVTDEYVLSKEDIVGKVYKVDIMPGVSITKSVLMDQPLDGITFERDLVFDYLPLGLKVGDYIDIRMVLPYGEEFLVLTHKRVQQLVESTNVIKVLLNEEELALWTSAMKDRALYSTSGLSLYVTKYVEPGISGVSLAFYPVRTEMEAIVMANNNILDKKRCINTSLREKINEMIKAVDVLDTGSLSGGNSSESSSINTSKTQYDEADKPNGTVTTKPGGTTGSAVGDAYDELINLEQTDLSGNTSGITDDQRDEVSGDNVFEGEDAIE